MTSKPRRERRAEWKEATWELYDEGGRAVGRALAYDPSREPEIWAQVRGLGVWERWHLAAFVRWWRIENPQEYNRAKSNRHYSRQRKLKQARTLEATREASIAEAMLTLTRPAKSPAPQAPCTPASAGLSPATPQPPTSTPPAKSSAPKLQNPNASGRLEPGNATATDPYPNRRQKGWPQRPPTKQGT